MSQPSWSFFRYGAVETFAWRLFIIWTAVGAIVLPLGINPLTLSRWISDPDYLDAGTALLAWADLAWMVFATVVVYLHVSAAEGLGRARVLALIIVLGAGAVEWYGATTGKPFGPYRYTDAFGPRIGGVLPIAIPLAWLVILLSARSTILARWPQLPRVPLALGVGLIALLTDLNLEFVAWKVRGYWIWYPGDPHPPAWPPLQNYVSWFVLATLLAGLLPAPIDRAGRPVHRVVMVLVAMNALFLVAHAVRLLR